MLGPKQPFEFTLHGLQARDLLMALGCDKISTPGLLEGPPAVNVRLSPAEDSPVQFPPFEVLVTVCSHTISTAGYPLETTEYEVHCAAQIREV